MANRSLDLNAWKVFWLLSPEGTVMSFRWTGAVAKGKLKELKAQGYKQLQDPFRKGAPLGGFKSREELCV